MNYILSTFNAVISFLVPSTTDKVMVGVFVGVIVLEWIILFVLRKSWSNGDAGRNVASTFVGMIFDALVGGLFAAGYLWAFHHLRIFTLPDGILSAIYIFLVVELVLYLQHWLYHRVGFFWALHSVHHSSTEMNVTVAPRSFWLMSLFVPIQMIVLPILGVGLVQLGVISLARGLWQYPVHSRVIPKLGYLEGFINTPANHRVHHGRQLKYLDRNFSEGFLLFDRLFGTHQKEEEEPDYGLVNQLGNRGLIAFQTAGIRHLFGQMRSAPKLRHKLAYLVMPPGWSHMGAHQTVRAMRQAQEKATMAPA